MVLTKYLSHGERDKQKILYLGYTIFSFSHFEIVAKSSIRHQKWPLKKGKQLFTGLALSFILSTVLLIDSVRDSRTRSRMTSIPCLIRRAFAKKLGRVPSRSESRQKSKQKAGCVGTTVACSRCSCKVIARCPLKRPLLRSLEGKKG